MMSTLPLDFEQKKGSMRAAWKAGNFGMLAKTLGTHEAQNFVVRLKLEPNTRVLDLACGTGAVTLPLARQGMIATGLDMVPELLDEARATAASEGLSVRFDEGFVEELPYPDASFDVVTSMFGAMFSSQPEVVASEIARVLKPGGLLAMANWTMNGFSGKMTQVPARYLPGRAGALSPMLWGEGPTACERLARDFNPVETKVVAMPWELPMGATKAFGFFVENAGPLQLMIGRLGEVERAALLRDFESLWIEENLASDKENRTLVRNEYLRVLATRR